MLLNQAGFNYEQAFIRNIGWITPTEQNILRNKTVAIAGMGGVGGIHLLTLTRLGIENFKIADMDTFELNNFNRQVGANMNTINQNKVDVLTKMALEINPRLNIKTYPEGITNQNVDAFLKNVDIFIDAIDFYAINIRETILSRCTALKIPAIEAAPLGMSTAYLIFDPTKMSFEEYFQLEKCSTEAEKMLNFIIGLNPKLVCAKYLMMPDTVNIQKQKGPSLSMACNLCAGVVGIEVLKICLKRGRVFYAPYSHLFDAYLNLYSRNWTPFGNRNPIQKIKRFFVRQKLNR